MTPVDSYLNALQKELARGDATEHTHRPALKTLIEASVAGLHATSEPKAAERENKPDYIVRKGATIIGFVEAKDVDKELKATRSFMIRKWISPASDSLEPLFNQ